jgi:hypothetical protein
MGQVWTPTVYSPICSDGGHGRTCLDNLVLKWIEVVWDISKCNMN